MTADILMFYIDLMSWDVRNKRTKIRFSRKKIQYNHACQTALNIYIFSPFNDRWQPRPRLSCQMCLAQIVSTSDRFDKGRRDIIAPSLFKLSGAFSFWQEKGGNCSGGFTSHLPSFLTIFRLLKWVFIIIILGKGRSYLLELLLFIHS